MLAELIELMKEQLPKVREAVEVLKEVIETDVRSVPDFDSSVLPDMFDAIEMDINAAGRRAEEVFPMTYLKTDKSEYV